MNKSITISAETTLSELATVIAANATEEQLLQFIVEIDQIAASWDFTKSLYDYFRNEMRKMQDDLHEHADNYYERLDKNVNTK